MQGQLFAQDFLRRGIVETESWRAVDGRDVERFESSLRGIYQSFGSDSVLDEAQTEQPVIERVLRELGWADDYLPQGNLSVKRREDVPDMLLFADAAAKDKALAENRDERRFRRGIALLEAKRWLRPQNARSRAEEFFEVDVAALLGSLAAEHSEDEVPAVDGTKDEILALLRHFD